MKSKTIIRISVFIIISFMIINFLWIINVSHYLMVARGFQRTPINFVLSHNDYSLAITLPSYLSFSGSLSITDNQDLAVIYWPSLFSTHIDEKGVIIKDGSKSFLFYVDNDFKMKHHPDIRYDDKELEEIVELLQINRDSLIRLDEQAISYWNNQK